MRRKGRLVRFRFQVDIRPLVSGSLQSLIETADKVVVIDRLAQEGNRSGLHRACPRDIVRLTRDENDRDAVTLGDQPVLQLDAA